MKEKILELIYQNTEQNDYEANTAQSISATLKISRNQVAQILHSLYLERKCIKITVKPLLFLSRKALEESCGFLLEDTEYSSIEEIFSKGKKQPEKKDFDKLIGAHGSLNEVVKQSKATVSYPPHGIPLLFHGDTGTGKSYMAQLLYEYSKSEGLIADDAKFLTLNCSEYANNPELITANLFGYVKGAFTGADEDVEGLLSLADGGILFLDEVHELKAENQEKLFLFMDQGIFHRMGDNKIWMKSNVRLIFATTEDPEKVLLKTLLRRIPVIINIPNLVQREQKERAELLYYLFSQEEQRINKPIRISSQVYQALLHYNFTGNIGELKSCIQYCCISSLFDNKDSQQITVTIAHLPKNVLDSHSEEQQVLSSQITYLEIHQLLDFVGKTSELIEMYNSIYKLAKKDQFNDISDIDEYQEIFTAYFENKSVENNQKQFYKKTVKSVVDIVASGYGLHISNNDVLSLTKFLGDALQYYFELQHFYEQYTQDFTIFYDYLKMKYYREVKIANEVAHYLEHFTDMELGEAVNIWLTLFFVISGKVKASNQVVAVILAHGFSTASSIAEAANKMLNHYVFDSIDMPLHVDTNTIVDRLNEFLSNIGRFDNLYLLVDMGSLEAIDDGIQIDHANVGIINNVTTKMALEVGSNILQEISMEENLSKIVETADYAYHMKKSEQKENVILCSCASGIGTAEKLKKIINDSLPNNIHIKVLTYDYTSLLEKKTDSEFFTQYNVLCTVGTLNPNIDGLKFIPIEQLIISDDIKELTAYLCDYMDEKDIEVFKRNMVKNFSLSNIMNALTILNPTQLLEYVANAIDRLQQSMELSFSNSTCFGLYVHISCLIERLVMNKNIESHADIEKFIEEHQSFIDKVKESFAQVEDYYGVTFTMEEIAYIYEYIENN